jgi:hypothetical protein
MSELEKWQCTRNLRELGQSCRTYNLNHHAWPASLRVLYESDPSISPATFVCPLAFDGLADDAKQRPWDSFSSKVSYTYTAPPSSLSTAQGEEVPLAWDTEEHPDGSRGVVYSSGRVESLDHAQFEARMGKK